MSHQIIVELDNLKSLSCLQKTNKPDGNNLRFSSRQNNLFQVSS